MNNSGDAQVEGGTGRFLLIAISVTIAFGALVLALSPSLYLPSMRDTPNAWMQKAQKHVEKKEYQQAISAFQKVLDKEPPRKSVFVKAEGKIKNLKEILKHEQTGESETGGGSETPETDKEENESEKEDDEDSDEVPRDLQLD
ncbi:MAG: tetratricopeptide repeat protein [Candidatus Brocadiia bacterium]